MANKIIHKHSSVITDGKAKLPTADQLEYGELAVNYAEGVETISMRNSANQIVEFKSTKALEDKVLKNELVTAHALTDLDYRLTEIEEGGYASKNVLDELVDVVEENEIVTAQALSELDERLEAVYTVIEDNELVTATALTDLDRRLEIVENAEIDIDTSNLATKTDFDNLVLEIEEAEFVTSTALTDLNTRLAVVEGNSGGASDNHTHGTITLSGDVTGSGTIGSGTTAINITTTVADNSHTHTSANITDSISTASGITSSATGLVQGKAVQAYAASKSELNALIAEVEDNEYVTALAVTELESRVTAIEEGSGNGSSNDHTHGTITLSGDVSGSGTIGSGTTAINITTVVADNSHAHTSANITDSISASSGITSSASGLVQGKAVQAYAAPKTHNHGTITLSGDVSGSATISGTNAVSITTTVADNSHAHTSANISDSISVSTNITSSATGLVQGKAVYGMVSTVETKLNDRINTLVTDIEDNEYVTALAITEIESRMTNMENITKDNEYVTALALTELERRITELQQTIASLQGALADVTSQLANTLTVE